MDVFWVAKRGIAVAVLVVLSLFASVSLAEAQEKNIGKARRLEFIPDPSCDKRLVREYLKKKTAIQFSTRLAPSLLTEAALDLNSNAQCDVSFLFEEVPYFEVDHVPYTHRCLYSYEPCLSDLMSQIGQLIGKWISELVNGWMADTLEVEASLLVGLAGASCLSAIGLICYPSTCLCAVLILSILLPVSDWWDRSDQIQCSTLLRLVIIDWLAAAGLLALELLIGLTVMTESGQYIGQAFASVCRSMFLSRIGGFVVNAIDGYFCPGFASAFGCGFAGECLSFLCLVGILVLTTFVTASLFRLIFWRVVGTAALALAPVITARRFSAQMESNLTASRRLLLYLRMVPLMLAGIAMFKLMVNLVPFPLEGPNPCILMAAFAVFSHLAVRISRLQVAMLNELLCAQVSPSTTKVKRIAAPLAIEQELFEAHAGIAVV